MATHLLANANVDTNLPTDITNFATDYKSKRKNILTTTGEYTSTTSTTSTTSNKLTLIQFGSETTSTTSTTEVKDFITATVDTVKINVGTIKTHLQKIINDTVKIEEIKTNIKKNIENLRTFVKTLSNDVNQIKTKLSEIYAVNSSIKIFTVLYIYVVLIDRFIVPKNPKPDGDDIVQTTCLSVFTTNAQTPQDICTNYFTQLSLDTLNKIKGDITTNPIPETDITIGADADKEIIKKINAQYEKLQSALSYINDESKKNGIISLLREAQYYKALSSNGSTPNPVGNNDLLKYVIDTLPLMLAFDNDATKIDGNLK
jgi:hypothetical protein